MTQNNFQKELRDAIKQYVSLDNYIKIQNAKLSEYRQKKKSIEDHILYTIRTYNLENIEINLPDGQLKYDERQTHSGITLPFLKTALYNYFSNVEKGNTPLDAQKKAENCFQFVMDQRETRIVPNLKRNFSRHQ